jgi:SsrA-binding protein
MKIKNKKAYFNYEVLDSFEAGIVLTGSEVKSFRKGRVNLGNAYVNIINGDLWLIGADIAKYEFSNDDFYDPTRSRKLLVILSLRCNRRILLWFLLACICLVKR